MALLVVVVVGSVPDEKAPAITAKTMAAQTFLRIGISLPAQPVEVATRLGFLSCGKRIALVGEGSLRWPVSWFWAQRMVERGR